MPQGVLATTASQMSRKTSCCQGMRTLGRVAETKTCPWFANAPVDTCSSSLSAEVLMDVSINQLSALSPTHAPPIPHLSFPPALSPTGTCDVLCGSPHSIAPQRLMPRLLLLLPLSGSRCKFLFFGSFLDIVPIINILLIRGLRFCSDRGGGGVAEVAAAGRIPKTGFGPACFGAAGLRPVVAWVGSGPALLGWTPAPCFLVGLRPHAAWVGSSPLFLGWTPAPCCLGGLRPHVSWLGSGPMLLGWAGPMFLGWAPAPCCLLGWAPAPCFLVGLRPMLLELRRLTLVLGWASAPCCLGGLRPHVSWLGSGPMLLAWVGSPHVSWLGSGPCCWGSGPMFLGWAHACSWVGFGPVLLGWAPAPRCLGGLRPHVSWLGSDPMLLWSARSLGGLRPHVSWLGSGPMLLGWAPAPCFFGWASAPCCLGGLWPLVSWLGSGPALLGWAPAPTTGDIAPRQYN